MEDVTFRGLEYCDANIGSLKPVTILYLLVLASEGPEVYRQLVLVDEPFSKVQLVVSLRNLKHRRTSRKHGVVAFAGFRCEWDGWEDQRYKDRLGLASGQLWQQLTQDTL